jgi:hypothetical protein
MEGRAMFTEEPIKGVRKEPEAVMKRVVFLLMGSAMNFFSADFLWGSFFIKGGTGPQKKGKNRLGREEYGFS